MTMQTNTETLVSRIEVGVANKVKVIGFCNEKMSMQGILSKLNLQETVEFDLAELRTMNSYGLRNFLQLIENIPDFKYHNCPPVFLDQINMLPALLGKTFDLNHIHSIRLDFICEEHKQELARIFPAPILPQQVSLDVPICPKQKHKMQVKQHLDSLLYCFGHDFATLVRRLRDEQYHPLRLAGLRHDLKHRLAVLQSAEPTNQFLWQNLHQLIDTLEDQTQQNSSDMSLGQIMEGLKKEIAFRAGKEKKTLDWPGQIPNVLIHAQEGIALKRILLNLLQNSTDYARSFVCFSLFMDSNRALHLEISDDGKVLPQEIQDLLQSQRLPDLSSVKDGRGLGLKTCQYLSQQINAILAYKHDGGKNHFSLHLPTKQIASQRIHPLLRLLCCCDKKDNQSRWDLAYNELSKVTEKRPNCDWITPEQIALIDLNPYLSIYTDQGDLASEALARGIPVIWAPTYQTQDELLQQLKRIL